MEVEKLNIKKRYVPISLSSSQNRQLCVFSDTSVQVIAAVAYLCVKDKEHQNHVGYHEQSKVGTSSRSHCPTFGVVCSCFGCGHGGHSLQ